jgi:hypothetical protein
VSFFPADPPLFFTVPFSCHQIDPVKEGLIDAGFININVTVVKLDKEITESLQFGRGLVLGNPFADQSLSRNRIDPDDVIAAMTRELRREFGADPGRMSMQSIVFSAEKPGQFKTS